MRGNVTAIPKRSRNFFLTVTPVNAAHKEIGTSSFMLFHGLCCFVGKSSKRFQSLEETNEFGPANNYAASTQAKIRNVERSLLVRVDRVVSLHLCVEKQNEIVSWGMTLSDIYPRVYLESFSLLNSELLSDKLRRLNETYL